MSGPKNNSIHLICGVTTNEDGDRVPSYGISYRSDGKEYTVRDLSTRRRDVENFVRRLRGDDNFAQLMDDLIEDFIS